MPRSVKKSVKKSVQKSTTRCSVKKLFKAIDQDGNGYVTQAEVLTAFKKAAGKDNKLTYKELTSACRRKSVTRGAANNCQYNLIDGNKAIIYEHNVNPGGFGANNVYFVADNNLDRAKLYKFHSYEIGKGDYVGNFVNVDNPSITKKIDFSNVNDRTRVIRVQENCSN